MEQFIGCVRLTRNSRSPRPSMRGVRTDGRFGSGMTARSSANSCGKLPAASQIALETSGGYYWMLEEMEQAGHQPRLAHALTAKRRMRGRHKTKREGCPRIGHAAPQGNPLLV
jgi:hypothetical protein